MKVGAFDDEGKYHTIDEAKIQSGVAERQAIAERKKHYPCGDRIAAQKGK